MHWGYIVLVGWIVVFLAGVAIIDVSQGYFHREVQSRPSFPVWLVRAAVLFVGFTILLVVAVGMHFPSR